MEFITKSIGSQPAEIKMENQSVQKNISVYDIALSPVSFSQSHDEKEESKMNNSKPKSILKHLTSFPIQGEMHLSSKLKKSRTFSQISQGSESSQRSSKRKKLNTQQEEPDAFDLTMLRSRIDQQIQNMTEKIQASSLNLDERLENPFQHCLTYQVEDDNRIQESPNF